MKVSFIGCGNMGEAVLAGLKKINPKCEALVCEPRAERRKFLKKKYGVTFVDSVSATVTTGSVVILAVKPQDLGAVLTELKGALSSHKRKPDPLFISIAAGVSTRSLEKALGQKARVIRTMPNLPALIGEGLTALTGGRYASAKDLLTARKIMQSVGATLVVKEKMIDAVTAVSGSGPAYVFLFTEVLIRSAQKLGFTPAEASLLVQHTLLGSAHLMRQSGETPESLRTKVTSKGGTTQAATEYFTQNGIFALYEGALRSARDRARALAI